MPKTTLTIEFDPDDEINLANYAHLPSLVSSNWDTGQMIRTALKHGDYDEKTCELLERLRDELYVEGLEK